MKASTRGRNKVSAITQARAKRTREFTVVQSNIRAMLTDPAKWAITGEPVGPDFVGLPSWWPFYADVIKTNTRELVRAARVLAKLEGVEL